MINGINHITFSVSNLRASLVFYSELLGLKLVGQWDRGAYLLAGDMWIALNLEEERDQMPCNSYTHIAFNVAENEFELLKNKLELAGVKPFKENQSAGDSFYFLDPDGHKLEIHYNTLSDRLEWARANQWKGFNFNE